MNNTSRYGIECDGQGFLIGTPVNLEDVSDSLIRIADDVRAIRAALGRDISGVLEQLDAPMPVEPSISVSAPVLPTPPAPKVDIEVNVDVAVPRQEPTDPVQTQGSADGAQPLSIAGTQDAGAHETQTATPEATPRQDIQQATPPIVEPTSVAEPRQRDARGRFEGGGAPGEAGAEQQREDRRFKELGDRITGAIGEPPEIDPFIAAYNEVARPAGRVMKSLAGDEKKQETWLKKIWRALTDPANARNQNGQGQQGGGLLDGLLGMLGLGGRGRGAPRIPPAAGAGAAGLLGSLGRGLAGFAKKLPLIGGLIAGAMTALGVLDSEADETTTRREKDEKAGKLVGGLGGMIAGGFAGSAALAPIGLAMGGPVGAAIAGVVGAGLGMFLGDQAGQIIGEKIGGWVNDLRTADVPVMIANAWNGFIGAITGTWDAAMYNIGETFSGMAAGVMSIFDGLKNAITGAIDTVKSGAKVLTEGVAAIADKAKAALKDATGIDLDEVAKNVTDAASAGVEAVKTGIVNVADKANTAVREATGVDVAAKANEAWETLQEGADKLKEKAEGMVTGAVEGAKTVVNNTVEAVKDGASKAGTAVKQGAEAVVNYGVNETTPGKIVKQAGVVAGAAYNKVSGTTEARQAVLLQTAKNAGITNPKELANFMGQVDHETGGFNRMEENLNYSAEGLLKTFNGRNGINTIEDARRVVSGGKEAIANTVYGGDWGKNNLGNTEDGDGFKYRGRGFKQLTGKDNYAQAGKALGMDLVNNPDMAQEPETAAKIAAWYWNKRVPDSAKQDVTAATQAINGGENGLADRKNRAAKWEAKIASGEADKISANPVTASIPPDGKSSLPPSVAALPIKGSDGKVRTLDEAGVKSWDELQAKGGQAFAGGENDPATLYATSLIAQDLGDNFGRVTAQNDQWHQANKPGSEHTKGNKTDFTIKGMDSTEANAKIAETMTKHGLVAGEDYKTLDEYKQLSPGGEGGHFDFKLTKAGQEKMRAKMQAEHAQIAQAQQPMPPTESPKPLAFKTNDPAQALASQVAPALTQSPTIANIPPAIGAAMPVSVSMIKPPAPIPAIHDAPSIPEPIAFGSNTASGGRVDSQSEAPLVGQDVRDRRIAHVVTGGMSNFV